MTIRLAAVGLAALLPLAANAAETRSGTLQGSRLDLDVSCVRSVSVQPDPALTGAAAYEAVADTAPELDRLSASGGDLARLKTLGRTGCRMGGANGGHVVVGNNNVAVAGSGSVVVATNDGTIVNGVAVGPGGRTAELPEATMRLTVRVPVGFPVRLALGGGVEAEVGEVRGPLRANISGAARVRAAAVGPVDAEISGSGSLTVASASGDVEAEVSGSGKVEILDGQVGDLKAEVSGVGSISVRVPVRDADLSVSGVGSIAVAGATGSLRRGVFGVGRITVDGR